MSARDKVRAIHVLVLKGYWIAKTREDERLCWRIMKAIDGGLYE